MRKYDDHLLIFRLFDIKKLLSRKYKNNIYFKSYKFM